MNTNRIALTHFLGIRRAEANDGMVLPFSENCTNHVGTVHAGAQFILVEVSSGDYLRTLFPEMSGKVFAVVRRAEIRYRKAGQGNLTARVRVDEEGKELFLDRLKRKGRALIRLSVDVLDADSVVTANAEYEWYVEILPG